MLKQQHKWMQKAHVTPMLRDTWKRCLITMGISLQTNTHTHTMHKQMVEIMEIYRNLNYILSYIYIDYILKTRKITS